VGLKPDRAPLPRQRSHSYRRKHQMLHSTCELPTDDQASRTYPLLRSSCLCLSTPVTLVDAYYLSLSRSPSAVYISFVCQRSSVMGGEPPYLYQRPSAHSFVNPNDRPYNPKAASHASWAPSQPRPKPTGPLIDSKEMNRHPDSYFIVYVYLIWQLHSLS
jgi:hypothetical protein